MTANIHPSWHKAVTAALSALQPEYREYLESSQEYFPDRENFLNAFKTLPLTQTRYILFGQDPYPRKESAIGYAFIDGKVDTIFTPEGLSKAVNRATSLRNFIKMLLLCEGRLHQDFSKEAIAKIDTSDYIRDVHQLRKNFEKNGVLLLNMALVFSTKEESKKHIVAWRAFVRTLLGTISAENIELILFGKIAEDINRIPEAEGFVRHLLPHPYNISFITDPKAHSLFGPMRLLQP